MKFRVFLMGFLCVVFCGCGMSYDDGAALDELDTGSVSEDDTDTGHSDDADDTIYVYACGEVVYPGVYEVKSDCRMFEVLSLAGGVTAEADLSRINQAELCYDGEKIYVPASGEYDTFQDGEAGSGFSDGRVNINTADSEELQQLKGIGASRAEDIISYREKNGKFPDIEAIMQVPGIKQGTFDKIKDQIKV